MLITYLCTSISTTWYFKSSNKKLPGMSVTAVIYCILAILIKMTNKMQLCRIIYYSITPWLLYMFRAILSLIIRSILTVITASGFIQIYCCRLLSWLSSVSWLLNMFRAILSLIIRSILIVITASGFIHVYCCRLLSWLSSVSWLLYMFRAILSLIIRSILIVITASGFIRMYRCRLL